MNTIPLGLFMYGNEGAIRNHFATTTVAIINPVRLFRDEAGGWSEGPGERQEGIDAACAYLARKGKL